MEPYVAPGATPVPVTISSLADAGFLDQASVAVLLQIRNDYGDEVVRAWDPEVFERYPLQTDGDIWEVLNHLRPLDHPSLWPIGTFTDSPAEEAVKEAVGVWYADVVRRGGKIPHWEITAFWFAAQAVRLASRLPSPLTATQLANHVAVWRESFRTALAWFITGGFDGKYTECPKFDADPEGWQTWWGYRSDLRHAGVHKEAEVLRTVDRGGPDGWAAVLSRFPGLWMSYLSCLYDIDEWGGSYPLPSYMQGRLDGLTRELSEDEYEED
jgi:hypothetical protein